MDDDALHPQSLAWVEALYEAWQQDPRAVPQRWRRHFAARAAEDGAPGPIRPRLHAAGPFARGARRAPPGPLEGERAELAALQHRVDQLVRNFRVRGHIVAALDPLGARHPEPPELDPAHYGFTDADLDRPFVAAGARGREVMTLRRILERMRATYCRSIGVQFMHIDDLGVREWLQHRMERTENRLHLERDEQVRILTRLTDAVLFEEFLQKKYVGAKSFSLEGGESLIPLLDLALERAGEQDIREIVFGMSHRGRLNFLANIIGKEPWKIFREFEDDDPRASVGSGDVKYHLGYSADWTTASGSSIHLSLCFNPSHLEFVGPVALGRMRAKQDRFDRDRGFVVLIHGDASFAGEGIVQETLNLSELDAYGTGGTLHVIVNNQIGFTTLPSQGRSSPYATDVARMLQIPIFHVNGEDPEAVAQVVRLAMDFRHRFRRDVVIDMYCYRRQGHNEGDEPAFTQPRLYERIDRRRSVRDGYLDHLLESGEVTREEADEIAERRRKDLEEHLEEAREGSRRPDPVPRGDIWDDYVGGADADVDEPDTGVEADRLAALLEAMTRVPDGFTVHKKIRRGMKRRRKMASGDEPLDWAAGEALALATLAVEGWRVRLTGQDSERGTFSHRHGVLHDVETGRTHEVFAHLALDQAPAEIRNSPLSEAGVLGFEYGYSLDWPDGLVMWEAQFGDFANAAQVVIDQFLASAEDKWNRLSGLVLLLPHGYEGQGPEHSSARLERFLQLAAEDNLQIVQPTTPAQLFHLLRRQVLRPLRKPLVVLTPKSLLRHPRARSPLADLTEGGWQRILPDDRGADGDERRVILCSGRVWVDLAAHRDEEGHDDVALVRVEQLHPLADAHLEEALAPYGADTPVLWVQDEPINMGASPHWMARFGERLPGGQPFEVLARAPSASPATGSHAAHELEQQELLERAFATD